MRHATIADIPDWPCPPRVRDIPITPNSWGWVSVGPVANTIAYDELGRLWARADAVPGFRVCRDTDANPGAILFATAEGLGLYIHPKSLPNLPTTSCLDHQPDEWIPVATVGGTPPYVSAAVTAQPMDGRCEP